MSFLGEIKRRKVFHVAAAYAVVAWLIIQIIGEISEPLSLPHWLDTVVIVLLAVGFPIALILAWAFDFTPEGVVKDQGSSVTAQSGSRRIEYVLIGLLVVAVGWLVYRDVVPSNSPTVADISPAPDLAESEPQLDVLPNSIAVLPFENLSLDPEDAFFAAGIHESTLNQLAKIRDLAVMSRTSVMQYKNNPPPIPEIAKAMNVETVMEGSVRYANGQVLITAQLIDGATGKHLWSSEFNRELIDVFAVQAEVAKQIATAMQVQLLPEEQASIESRPTESINAYQYYLHALSLPFPAIRPEYWPAYVDSMERAIAADPEFAEAYAELSWSYNVGGEIDKAAEYAQKAIDLDSTVGLAYLTLADIDSDYHDRQEASRSAYEQALRASPNNPFILSSYGYRLADNSADYDEAIQVLRRAVAIDPTASLSQRRLGFVLMRAGDLAGAAEYVDREIKLDPITYYEPYLDLAMIEFLGGNYGAAEENLDRAMRIMSPNAIFRVDYVAYLYGLLGNTELAEDLMARFEEVYGEEERQAGRTLGWGVLGTRDKKRALREWTITVDGYLLEDWPVSPGRITRFRDNWLNDPMLEEPEFLELRGRLGFMR